MPAPDPKRLRRATTTAAVFDHRGHILLHLRRDNGLWALPGGAIEPEETADQNIVREVLEETGYQVQVVRLVGVYSDPEYCTITYPGGDVVIYISILFECRITGGNIAANDESADVRWFAPDALPDTLMKNHRPRVADALARQTAAFYR